METLEQIKENFKDLKMDLQKIVEECDCNPIKIKKRINIETEFYCQFLKDDEDETVFVLLHKSATRFKREKFLARQDLSTNFDLCFKCQDFDTFDYYFADFLDAFYAAKNL